MLKVWKNVYEEKCKVKSKSRLEYNVTDSEEVKDNIIVDVGRAIKLVLQLGIENSSIISSEHWVANDLSLRLDEALRHGLRRPLIGYWSCARVFTHANNIKLLEALHKNTLEKSRAWLNHSLNEGSFESYLLEFTKENSIINKYYKKDALIRDHHRKDILLGLIVSLREINFHLSFSICDVTPVASPEDSGVATIDESDDVSSETLDDQSLDKEDDEITFNEVEDNRINRILSLDLDSNVNVTTMRNNKSNRKILKRVSFHEESYNQELIIDKEKQRHSWCAQENDDNLAIICNIKSTRITKKEKKIIKRKMKSFIYLPGIHPNIKLCDIITDEIKNEFESNKLLKEEKIIPLSINDIHFLTCNIFENRKEIIHKVYKVVGPLLQVEISPLWIILTNNSIYFLSNNSASLTNIFHVKYKNILSAILGPDGQIMQISNIDKESIMFVADTFNTLTQLITDIEIIMRKLHLQLPFWNWLSIDDMKFLKRTLNKLLPSIKGEKIIYYCTVHIQDETKYYSREIIKQGLLMMKIEKSEPWLPVFLELRNTELWIFSDEEEKEPELVLNLLHCNGCHRSIKSDRPYTFEIISGTSIMELAAADEYHVSDWLQAIIQALTTSTINNKKLQLCGLVLTNNHLITYSLDNIFPEIICCAPLSHLHALHTIPREYWCVLEFECSEVHNSNGDLILYFSSQENHNNFCVQLQTIWNSFSQATFPIINEMQENLMNRFLETSIYVKQVWDLTVNLNI